jgi:hypothetical protein
MDLFLVSENPPTTATGKVITIALLGIAALVCTHIHMQSWQKLLPQMMRTILMHRARMPLVSQRG